MKRITPCLWFENNAMDAVKFYTSVFQHSEIGEVSHYTDAGPLPKGTVLTVMFKLDGQEFMALNGGPAFKFNPAISFAVDCKDQAEIDYYYDALRAGGGQEMQCGWITDRFGVAWQVFPSIMRELVANPKAMQAMMKMKKLDIAELERAAKEK